MVTIQIGSTVGSYEVVSLLGKGGMGEVYRARDMKLKRDVALKVLPAEFSDDADRVTRLQREAEVLASLNHPNIAMIYDLQEKGGSQYLVLELVEGETIADRLRRGAIPMDEALPVARGICEALEAAHERGIVHRDLKPANVKITPDGRVKVLDFGLARMHESAGRNPNSSHSPTLTLMHTAGGVILGTAAYMSPEQARGKFVDKRSDVWSFGCVLYEMLTGSRAFDGQEVTDIIAAIVRAEPDWSTLPADTPAAIRRLLRRCLEKDRLERLPDIAMARIEIRDSLAGAADTGERTENKTPFAQATSPRRFLAWLLASAFAISSAAMLFLWQPWRTTPPQALLTVSVELGADVSLASDIQGNSALAISPDGSTIAFVGEKGGVSQLYVRRLDQLQATALAGTAGAITPFFKPDGQEIGFFAEAKLKKISVRGGPPVTVCDAPVGRGASWGDDGNIVFQSNGQATLGLSRVSSEGGVAQTLTKLESGYVTHRWPQVLPGATAVLYTASVEIQSFSEANIVVQPLTSGAAKVIITGGYHAKYLDSGHIIYIHDGTLFAVPFDLKSLETSGPPVPVAEGVNSSFNTAAAQFAVSRTGNFIHLTGGTLATNEGPIVSVERQKTSPLWAESLAWSSPEFSPDGTKLAIDTTRAANLDIWIYDLARDTATPLTFDPGVDARPSWTHDGKRIAFASNRHKGSYNLYWQPSDGTGDAQRLTESANVQWPASWHFSGKYLAFEEIRPQTGQDIMILPMEGSEVSGWKPGKPYPFLATSAEERAPRFSPDGRWISYTTLDSSGGSEVFVRPFPGPGGQWKISTNGGRESMWSTKRQELLYLSYGNHIMSVSFSVEGDRFAANKPVLWSQQLIGPRPRRRWVDLHPDGDRIAAFVPNPQAAEKRDKIVLITNFFDKLRRVASSNK